MSDYGSVFRSPSYWVALLAGVGGIALAVRQEMQQDRSGSSARLSGKPAVRCRECGSDMVVTGPWKGHVYEESGEPWMRGHHVGPRGGVDRVLDANHVAVEDSFNPFGPPEGIESDESPGGRRAHARANYSGKQHGVRFFDDMD